MGKLAKTNERVAEDHPSRFEDVRKASLLAPVAQRLSAIVLAELVAAARSPVLDDANPSSLGLARGRHRC